MKLYYLPLETYPERASALMSCRDGWVESCLKRHGIDFTRVEGEQIASTIGAGSVLDAQGRCHYATTQTARLIKDWLPKLADDDIIYVEDFFHPSVESLFYIRHLTGAKWKVATFCYAQSVDDTDFTYPMREWMRPLETAYARQYDFIFVCSPILKQLLLDAGVCNARRDNIHVTGLPFDIQCLNRQLVEMGAKTDWDEKEDFVLFSSRFDDEKDPMFFLDLVEECKEIKFKIVSPYTTRPPSRNPAVMERLNRLLGKEGGNLELVHTPNKKAYYETLAKARVQFNCALQDWVSWTLIEASLFRCAPLYPKWKDFPAELDYDHRFLYERKNLADAAEQLRWLMKGQPRSYPWVAEKHDRTWLRQLAIMGFDIGKVNRS